MSKVPGLSAFYSTVEAMCETLERLRAGGDDAVLAEIGRITRACMADRRARGKVVADRRLDAACQTIGRDLLSRLPPAAALSSAVDCVILGTEVYRSGGHTAVIGDLLATGRFGPRITLLLTNAFGTTDLQIAQECFGSNVRIEIAPSGSLISKTQWTLERLSALRPGRLVLMNHPEDAVAIAAAQPGLAQQTIFYHHADQILCLGVTLDHVQHIDPHPMGFHHCRHHVGLNNVLYWPLVAQDFGPRPGERAFRVRGHLQTACSGSLTKFETAYKYPYQTLICNLIQRTGGSHLHIGPLSEATLAQVRAGLAGRAIDQDRFKHLAWVPSVWLALQQHDVDIYLDSFPLGGGRAVIESMGAGVPVIAHQSYISPLLGDADMLYPGAFAWSQPDQLLEHVESLTAERLAQESLLARHHYEKNHSAEALGAAIDAGLDAPPPAALQPSASDPMQSFLDDVALALSEHLTVPWVEAQERLTLVHQAELSALERGYQIELNERTRLANKADR